MDEDRRLLGEYQATYSQEVFARLVACHVNMVHATALRAVGEAHLADDVTQAVFLLLWQNAAKLKPNTILAGWLFKTARNVSARAIRSRARRQRHESQAAAREIDANADRDLDWERISPALDGAIARLRRPERDAILLRYFQGRDYEEIGAALGISAGAAKMRVSRAVKTLRNHLGRAGVSITVPVLITGMEMYASPVTGPHIAAAAANTANTSAAATSLAEGVRRSARYRAGLNIAAVLAVVAALILLMMVKHHPQESVTALHASPPESSNAASTEAPPVAPGLPRSGLVIEAVVEPALLQQIRTAGRIETSDSSIIHIDRARLAELLTGASSSRLRAISAGGGGMQFPQTLANEDLVPIDVKNEIDILLAGTPGKMTYSISGTMTIASAPDNRWEADFSLRRQRTFASPSGGGGGQGRQAFRCELSRSESLVITSGQMGIGGDPICPIEIIQLDRPPPAGDLLAWLRSQ